MNLPRDTKDSHYYAARETSAAPLRVTAANGSQQEKFLFYRGVSGIAIPLSTQLQGDGNLLIKNLGQSEVPDAILFDRRGDKIGYRLGGKLQSEMLLQPPVLTASIEQLYSDLEQMLIGRGL